MCDCESPLSRSMVSVMKIIMYEKYQRDVTKMNIFLYVAVILNS